MNGKAFIRVEDWTNLVAGIYMVLVPVLYATVHDASVNAYITGPVIAVIALTALAYPRLKSAEWTQLLAGAWLFIAPWALSFTSTSAAAWNAWIVGAIVVLLAGTRLVEQGSREGLMAGPRPRTHP